MTTSPSARTPTIACLRKPSCSGSVTATIWITPASWRRATRCRTAASESPTARAIVAYGAPSVLLQLLDDRLADVVEQSRAGTHQAAAQKGIRCQTVPGNTDFIDVIPNGASKYVVQRSSILAAEITRPEAA